MDHPNASRFRFRPQAYLAHVDIEQPMWWTVLTRIIPLRGVQLKRIILDPAHVTHPTAPIFVLIPPRLSADVILNTFSSRDEQREFGRRARLLFPVQQQFLLYLPTGRSTTDDGTNGTRYVNTLHQLIDACSESPKLMSKAAVGRIVESDTQRVGKKLSHDLASLVRLQREDGPLREHAIHFIVRVHEARGLGFHPQADDLSAMTSSRLREVIDSLLNIEVEL